ncbi:uncharacterized protein A4U43_C10F4720 [Asparagus officinalis]|uniref:Uncharacterized protein n=1 Tax=Asparagus officinalis TaxID=4686 RepID=A0A5P1E551_ASPOF|nr:uncharacterized protein A4U43_C10F4720 [Asparagus officinalis]
MQEPRIGSSSKEPIPLDAIEEQVDYGHDDTDAYLTEPDDTGDIGDIGGSSYMLDDEPDFEIVGEAMPTSFLASGHIEHVINFEDGDDKDEFYCRELHGLHTTDLDNIIEVKFRHLLETHHKAGEFACAKMERINMKVQSLSNSITSANGHLTELQGDIQKTDATINEAKATIATAEACLEAAQHQKEDLELNLA